MTVRIVGARAVLADGCVRTDVLCDGDTIAEVGGTARGDVEIDARGLTLAPAMVDVHGDAFERQLMPRPGVDFPLEAALLETDRQLAGNGIGTAYHALTLGWEPGLRSVERGRAVIDALDGLRHRFGVEQRVQLRWETFAVEALELVERSLGATPTPSLAFNDHTSMLMRAVGLPVQARDFEHDPDYAVADTGDPAFLQRLVKPAGRSGLAVADYAARLADVWARRADVPGRVSALASDYHYPAMLAAVRRLVDERRASLADAWALVSSGPARLMGLADRGVIEPGRRADLVLIDWPEGGAPVTAATVVGGRFAYRGAGCP